MTSLKGSCHCGAVKFEVRNQDKPEQLARCNCSLCRRRGAIMATAPVEDLVIIEGEDKLSLYQWNTRIARHYFCSVCGIYTHHRRRRFPEEHGFNVACIEGMDMENPGDIQFIDGQQLTLESPIET